MATNKYTPQDEQPQVIANVIPFPSAERERQRLGQLYEILIAERRLADLFHATIDRKVREDFFKQYDI